MSRKSNDGGHFSSVLENEKHAAQSAFFIAQEIFSNTPCPQANKYGHLHQVHDVDRLLTGVPMRLACNIPCAKLKRKLARTTNKHFLIETNPIWCIPLWDISFSAQFFVNKSAISIWHAAC
jgi:hypothetical protein